MVSHFLAFVFCSCIFIRCVFISVLFFFLSRVFVSLVHLLLSCCLLFSLLIVTILFLSPSHKLALLRDDVSAKVFFFSAYALQTSKTLFLVISVPLVTDSQIANTRILFIFTLFSLPIHFTNW